jgi:outer membrane receptor protein involved in Fe transport
MKKTAAETSRRARPALPQISRQGRPALTAPARPARRVLGPTRGAGLVALLAFTTLGALAARARAAQGGLVDVAPADSDGADGQAATPSTAPAPASSAPPPAARPGAGARDDESALSLDEVATANASEMGGIEQLDLANLLENFVVSATKTEVKEDEAPAITTVITSDEIRRWGYQSVAEVLRHAAGFYVIDDHILPNVGLRGVSGGLRSESGLI